MFKKNDIQAIGARMDRVIINKIMNIVYLCRWYSSLLYKIMLEISAVIITFNEEKNIGRCIDSLQDVVDEVVVVDSFSTDKTEAICQEKGVKFIQHPFEGHIEQKNYAITQASFPVVLSLDADEALDSALRSAILAVKQDWQADGYTMNRVTNYCGKWIWHGGWYPDTKLRLWDSRKGKWAGMNPHDEFIMEQDSKIAHLKGNLLHYSYDSVEGHIVQMNKFTSISAKSYYQKGKRSNLFLILLKPLVAFIKTYFIKRGFLSGYSGFLIGIIDAQATFLKYVKLLEYQKKQRGNT